MSMRISSRLELILRLGRPFGATRIMISSACWMMPTLALIIVYAIDESPSNSDLSVRKEMKATATNTFTSRDLHRDPGSIERAALSGPVFITDRNRPSLVMMAIEDYERIAGCGPSLLDMLMPGD